MSDFSDAAPVLARTDRGPQPSYLTSRRVDGALVLTGELDELAVDRLEADLREHSRQFRSSLVLDLSEVTYLCSHAVSVLVTSTKKLRANDAELHLVAVGRGAAQQVLQICGIPHQRL